MNVCYWLRGRPIPFGVTTTVRPPPHEASTCSLCTLWWEAWTENGCTHSSYWYGSGPPWTGACPNCSRSPAHLPVNTGGSCWKDADTAVIIFIWYYCLTGIISSQIGGLFMISLWSIITGTWWYQDHQMSQCDPGVLFFSSHHRNLLQKPGIKEELFCVSSKPTVV